MAHYAAAAKAAAGYHGDAAPEQGLNELFLPVMRTQGNDSHIHLGVVDFINHAILLIDASRPRLFKDIMLQMLHLSRASARMFLQFYKHVGYLLERRLVATLFDDGKLCLGIL